MKKGGKRLQKPSMTGCNVYHDEKRKIKGDAYKREKSFGMTLLFIMTQPLRGNDVADKNMNAYIINKHILCADVLDKAKAHFQDEVEEHLPDHVEEIGWDCMVPSESGENMTIRDIINRVLGERNAWLRMGIPCYLHSPFIIVKLP